MEISPSELFAEIGEQRMTIRILERQVAALTAELVARPSGDEDEATPLTAADRNNVRNILGESPDIADLTEAAVVASE